MNITVSERPGVYTGYDASSVLSGAQSAGAVGVICKCDLDAPTRFITAAAAREALGAASKAAKYAELAISGGAAACVISPVASENGDYAAAAAALREQDVSAICCDAADAETLAAIKTEVTQASAERHERIAVFAPEGSATQLTAMAASLASERCVVVGPLPTGADGAVVDPTETAVAVAAAIVSLGDPAIPLGGAVLKGMYGSGGTLADSVVDTLVRGGVTPIECVAGEIQVVRGITTRVSTGGDADNTWRELSTVLIVDNVMKTLRSSLRSKFARAKNIAETREAVASQVSIELAAKKSAGIIADYGSVSATAADGDPTRCDVEFEFAVAHGLDRIVVNAHLYV